ncbi:MFS transporter [Sphingobium algorifonticola]|uniref:MFS transporter n=1 Tax=Sphingobium algorifonticola TaxID=2008318 RepID=A0A437J9R6_9SPHN|nr:MFS transporter [Sphingobium algorifonticola]RVT42249.1 MFS transporter [Sphingobium algorifonticola]
MPPDRAAPTSDRRFLLLYALAWAGVSIAYTPLLTILLPVHVDGLADDRSVHWLAAITFVGACAASVANILFGWLSDITRNRRNWVATGLLLSALLLLAIPHARGLASLIFLVVAWQIGLNMMIAPLAAWAADCVPDGLKGQLGGLLAFAPATGALTGALVTVPGLADPPTRFAIVAAFTAVCILPLLLLGQSGTGGQTKGQTEAHTRPWHHAGIRTGTTRMWCARFLVQISEAALFAYLYLWFRSVDPGLGDASAARILAVVLFLAAPCALLAGRWADRRNRPIAPLRYAAVLAAIGLTVMALASSVTGAILGYVLFGLATNIFLALHSAQTLRVLPDGNRRGRDLGIFNLTNTLPSLFMPSLTLSLVPALGFPALFAVLALLATGAAVLLAGSQPPPA